ncbi:MAG: hypothetical protein KC417_01195 [Myxococcales bacterium]|nr:hypothetical protein [Myxococcales bacterium]
MFAILAARHTRVSADLVRASGGAPSPSPERLRRREFAAGASAVITMLIVSTFVFGVVPPTLRLGILNIVLAIAAGCSVAFLSKPTGRWFLLGAPAAFVAVDAVASYMLGVPATLLMLTGLLLCLLWVVGEYVDSKKNFPHAL